MSQFSLTYGPQYEGHQSWLKQLEVLRSAVSHLGAKEVIDQLDISRSTLSEALNERNDKRVAAEWVHTIKAMLVARRADPIANDLLRNLCEADVAGTDLMVGDAIEITDEERAVIASVLEKTRKTKRRAA